MYSRGNGGRSEAMDEPKIVRKPAAADADADADAGARR
jgi:hypothetical protein